jgi:uncharacterized protein YutE (UPF0331/DUF86 family)
MSPSKIREKVVTERLFWVANMISAIRSLPLGSFADFTADARNMGAAESYLRRALEALLDTGRHVLAKGFGKAAVEYKEIASGLKECGIIDNDTEKILHDLAGYRNRMVHFYDEITDDELYGICSRQLTDIELIAGAISRFIQSHPEMVDTSL